MADAYWKQKFDAATGMYKCPWCERDLKPKLSQSAKNPGKVGSSFPHSVKPRGELSLSVARFLPGYTEFVPFFRLLRVELVQRHLRIIRFCCCSLAFLL